MNKNDVERYNFKPEVFYKWLSEKSEYYNYEKIASNLEFDIPVEGKGFENEKGRQGIWKSFDNGKLSSLDTWVDNKRNGPFINFFENGKISERGTQKETRSSFDFVGEYESFFDDGTIQEKGKYDEKGKKIGKLTILTLLLVYIMLSKTMMMTKFQSPA
jgi:antitoxin component YwqK of YwqJK toxin-antitoxin module